MMHCYVSLLYKYLTALVEFLFQYTDLYDSLRVRAIGQAIGQAIGNRAWSPKALTIYLSSMY